MRTSSIENDPTKEGEVKSPADLAMSRNSSNPSKRRKSDPFNDWDTHRDAKIEVNVTGPIIKEELLMKHFVYKVSGTDVKGYFDVQRRYSDFDKVRSLLVAKWPGCFVPGLPVKDKSLGKKAVVEDRTKLLYIFTNQIAQLPHLHYSDVYQVFLRSPTSNLDSALQPYKEVKYQDIIERYSIVFSHLAGKEISHDAALRISTFQQFLQKAQPKFKQFKKLAKKYIIARKEYTDQLEKLHTMMGEGYEKNVFAEYHNRNLEKHIFFDPSKNKNDIVEKIREDRTNPSVENIREWINSEDRDINAFLEAFKEREKYESLKGKAENRQRSETKELQNLHMGKSSLMSMVKRENKDQAVARIEETLTNVGRDIEHLETVKDMITMVLAFEEIERFKSSRVQTYYDIIANTALKEIGVFNTVLSYWNSLLENPNVKELEN